MITFFIFGCVRRRKNLVAMVIKQRQEQIWLRYDVKGLGDSVIEKEKRKVK